MSQLLAPTHTFADSIPLGRRINEIMMEKGAAYTISAMAKRLEINRETLRLMLKGEREIYTFELEKIAEDLKVPVERILQDDVAEISRRISELIQVKGSDVHLVKELAEKYHRVAIGYTERAMGYNLLGNAYYGLQQFGVALDLLQQGIPYAQVVMEKFQDPKWSYFLSINILNVKIFQRDYQGVEEILQWIETVPTDDLRTKAVIAHNWGLFLEEWKSDIDGAREKHYQSMNYYLQTNQPQKMGLAYFYVAMFEYRQNNFAEAIPLFQKAWEHLQKENGARMLTNVGRDYAKLMIQVHQYSEAAEILNQVIAVNQILSDTKMEAQLLFLLAIAEEKPSHAEEILRREIGTISLRKLANEYIIDHYKHRGEEDLVMHFKINSRLLGKSPIDRLLRLKLEFPGYLITLFDHCTEHRWLSEEY